MKNSPEICRRDFLRKGKEAQHPIDEKDELEVLDYQMLSPPPQI